MSSSTFYQKDSKTTTAIHLTTEDNQYKVDDKKITANTSTLIPSILNDISVYKNRESYDKQTYMEMLGFALVVSQEFKLQNEEKNIFKKMIGEIEDFAFKEAKVSRNMVLANLAENIESFKTRINTIRLKCKKNKPLDMQKEFIALLKNIFDVANDILEGPPKTCEYAIMALGSVAMNRVTPFSNVQYMILVLNQHSSYIKYFNLFNRLVNLIITTLGESPLSKETALLNRHQQYFPLMKKGFSLQDNTKSTIPFINTTQELLTLIPNNIMHEPSNFTTSALLSASCVTTNSTTLDNLYKTNFCDYLRTKNYALCLVKLINSSNLTCGHFSNKLEVLDLNENTNENELIDLNQLLMLLIHLPRLLLLFTQIFSTNAQPEHHYPKILSLLQEHKVITQTQCATWITVIEKMDKLKLSIQLKNNSNEAQATLIDLKTHIGLDQILTVLNELTASTTETLKNYNQPQKINTLSSIQKSVTGSGHFASLNCLLPPPNTKTLQSQLETLTTKLSATSETVQLILENQNSAAALAAALATQDAPSTALNI